MMVDFIAELTAKKSCEYEEYDVSEHILSCCCKRKTWLKRSLVYMASMNCQNIVLLASVKQKCVCACMCMSVHLYVQEHLVQLDLHEPPMRWLVCVVVFDVKLFSCALVLYINMTHWRSKCASSYTILVPTALYGNQNRTNVPRKVPLGLLHIVV